MSEAKKQIKGNRIVIKCLEHQGVDLLFAYPGGFSMELHQALQESDMRVILPRHEQGGAFAANGYAKASGRVGVCMATSGPGATNLLSGIADAYMDSVPTVFITGQVPTTMIGKNVFQETDIIGMTRPIVKHSYLVLDAKDLPRIFNEAFYLARSGRPGPVMIDIPKNIQQQMLNEDEVDYDCKMDIPTYKTHYDISPEDVKAIKDAIAASEKPCLYTGGGIITAEASEELLKFAEGYNLPVVTTLMGIGSLPDNHPLHLHWLGMHGNAYANYTANECDLLIAFGARFDDRVTGDPVNFARDAKIIHVDIDESEINKNKPADIGIVADIKDMLIELNREPVFKEFAAWHKQIKEWREKYPLTYVRKPGKVQPQFVLQKLAEMTNGQAVIVPGVGQHQMFASQYYTYNYPRQLITSGGLGAMGFGLPAAMGAKLACPDKMVINIDGDGSFQMNIQELGTLHVEDIPVKCVILNNQHLGMVAQWEDRFYGSVRGNTEMHSKHAERPFPDFVTIAKGFLVPGREVYHEDELEDALREMLESPGPFVLDVHTGYEEHVLPMIPPGRDYKSIILE